MATFTPVMPEDIVAEIKIKLHGDGAMSVAGNIVDVNLALTMLDAAKDAVKSQLKERDKLMMPNSYVPVPTPLVFADNKNV